MTEGTGLWCDSPSNMTEALIFQKNRIMKWHLTLHDRKHNELGKPGRNQGKNSHDGKRKQSKNPNWTSSGVALKGICKPLGS